MTSERGRNALLAIALLSGAPCAYAAPSANAPLEAQYSVFTHGLHVANVVATYQLQPWGYGVTTELQAGGLMSWFLRMNVRSTASGRFDNGQIDPVSYDSSGFSRGANRHIAVQYRGGVPAVTIHTPPETDRDPVPEAQLPHAIDTLSAMALLLDSMEKTGKCDGEAHVFDGIRLTAMQSHGPVQTTVPDDDGEFYHGPALRCDFIGQQIAGFVTHSSHLADMQKARPGAAWFQNLPGIGMVAVRIEFDHPKLGHLIGVLRSPPIQG